MKSKLPPLKKCNCCVSLLCFAGKAANSLINSSTSQLYPTPQQLRNNPTRNPILKQTMNFGVSLEKTLQEYY